MQACYVSAAKSKMIYAMKSVTSIHKGVFVYLIKQLNILLVDPVVIILNILSQSKSVTPL